jgi:MFS family permease
VILAALVLAVAALVATGLTTAVPLLFITMFVGGLAQGALQTTLLAASLTMVPPNRAGSTLGLIGFFSQCGWFVAPPVAGLLLHWLSMPADFIAMSLPIAAVALLAFAGLGSAGSSTGTSFELRRPLRLLSQQRGFTSVLLMMLGSTLGWGAFQTYFPLFAKHGLGLTAVEIGYLLALQAVANGGSRVAGGLYDRVRRKGLVVCLVLLGFAAGLELIARSSGFWLTAGLLLLAIGCLGMGLVGVTLVFAQIAPEASRRQAMGLFSTLQFLGIAVSPALVAPVMNYSLGLGFQVVGLLVAAVVVASLFARRPAVTSARLLEVPNP